MNGANHISPWEEMLSGDDIRNILDYPIPIWTTSQLYRVKDINRLFYNEYGQRFDNALILYQQKHIGPQVIGHWTLLKRIDNNNIAHFDSYGDFIDDHLDKISLGYRKLTNQVKRHLSRLLADSNYKNIHYSPYKYQNHYRIIKLGRTGRRMKIRVNTCGRHCIVYARSPNEPEKYHENMKRIRNAIILLKKQHNEDDYTTYDDIVCALT